jgi:transcription elongation regulator 1
MNQGLVYNAPVLPTGWIEYRTPTGQPYWYNSTTRQSSWVFPTEATPLPAKQKQIKKKIPGTHWLFVITFDGYEFFYDRDTKTSIWEMPEELKEAMELLLKQEQEDKKRALQEEEENEAKRIKLEKEEAGE